MKWKKQTKHENSEQWRKKSPVDEFINEKL